MSVKFDFGSLGKPFEADWPVSVSVPIDGGKVETQEFMAHFRQLSGDEIDEALKTEGYDYKTLPRLFFIGLGAGETMAFNDGLREAMLDRPYIREALNTAYRGFTSGVAAGN